MKIVVVDCKRNEMIKVKVELSNLVFLVVPEIVDSRFNYMRQRILDIRKRYMNIYLEDTSKYRELEQQLYEEIRESLIKEMEHIHRTEGIMYYTR